MNLKQKRKQNFLPSPLKQRIKRWPSNHPEPKHKEPNAKSNLKHPAQTSSNLRPNLKIFETTQNNILKKITNAAYLIFNSIIQEICNTKPLIQHTVEIAKMANYQITEHSNPTIYGTMNYNPAIKRRFKMLSGRMCETQYRKNESMILKP
ncbi:hypothetical protein TcasGA2_TC008739 [Tribolium castaneum]|uniref:Uncharacterized protein n=1 Tax=Tribolium castaneum TaxID=7070 RepID=D6WS77_TRICA|nr:hypothetical protein TcasGA2_TC008739 [Tribolium castaneum]